MPPQINNRIRRLRFDAGEITQQELADAVGASRQTIIALEAGKYGPSLALAFRIARHFGKNIEEVFEYAETAEPHGGDGGSQRAENL